MINNTATATRCTATLVLALTLLLSALLISCGQPDAPINLSKVIDERMNTDINGTLLEQMASHRIILIADIAHGQWQPRQTVADFLDRWFNEVTEHPTGKTSRKLAMLMENDSVYVAKILKYGSSGDPGDILDIPLITSGTFTTASMEFYTRLGDLIKRVQDWNASHDDSFRVDFTLLPGENHIDVTNWSIQKRSDYFLHDRDFGIYNRIATFVDTHPEYKIVGFYGAGHLVRHVVEKRSDIDSAEGRFVASYLDSLMPGSLFTVGQITAANFPLEAGDSVYRETAYAMLTSSSNPRLHRMLSGGGDYDMVVVYPTFRFWGTPITHIPSINVARIAIDDVPIMMDTANGFTSGMWPHVEGYISAVTSETPHRTDLKSLSARERTYEKWKAWSRATNGNIVPDILNLRVWQRLADRLGKSPEQIAQLYDREFCMLQPQARPGAPIDGIRQTPGERADELREYLMTNKDDIVINTLIDILWVGNKQERDSAQRALVRLTGESFTTPTQWSEWRR